MICLYAKLIFYIYPAAARCYNGWLGTIKGPVISPGFETIMGSPKCRVLDPDQDASAIFLFIFENWSDPDPTNYVHFVDKKNNP